MPESIFVVMVLFSPAHYQPAYPAALNHAPLFRRREGIGRQITFSAQGLDLSGINHNLIQGDHFQNSGQGPVQDDFFNPKRHITASQAIGLFSAGFAVSVGGLATWRLFRRQGAQSARQGKSIRDDMMTGVVVPDDKVELNPSKQISGSSVLYRAAALDPQKHGAAFIGYLASSVIGYLSATTVQGAQESWVRRQETLIRASLINRLTGAFRTSIQMKQQMDERLRHQAETRVYQVLQKAGIANAHQMVMGFPVVEPLSVQQQYLYQPTHRTVRLLVQPNFAVSSAIPFSLLSPNQSASTSAGIQNSDGIKNKGSSPQFGDQVDLSLQNRIQRGQSVKALSADVAPNKNRRLLLETSIFSLGAAAGVLGYLFTRLLGIQHADQTSTQTDRASASAAGPDKLIKQTSEYETWLFNNLESWWISLKPNQRSIALLSGFLGMTALSTVGKLAVDALRELEVTRRNSQTEYLYQKHNWLSQDPAFHQIAEEESLNYEINTLIAHLPWLQMQPEMLQQRIETILSNIGRNSAPKYFAMTPAVNLVDARG